MLNKYVNLRFNFKSLLWLSFSLLFASILLINSSVPDLSAMAKEQKRLYQKGINYYDLACQSQNKESAEPAVDGSLQDLAKQMLENKNITYWQTSTGDTKAVVKAMADGKKAFTTSSSAPKKEVDLNPNILKFILDAAKEGKIMVNALTDKNHTGTTSPHYRGLAVDLDINPGNTSIPVSKLNEIAKKYGGTKNTESDHHHYDFPNRPKDSDKPAKDEAADSSGSEEESAGSNLGCGCPTEQQGQELEGKNNAVKAYNYLITQDELKLSPAAVAGIIGNMMRESGGDGYNLNPDITGHGQCIDGSDCYGIVQWGGGRVPAMRNWAKKNNKDSKKLATQVEYVKVELLGAYKGSTLKKLQGLKGNDEGAASEAAAIFNENYEIGADQPIRMKNAARFFKQFVKGKPKPSGGGSSSESSTSSGSGSCGEAADATDANLKKTIKVDKPGKFITMPAKYGCGGQKAKIDSRIAAGVAYLMTKYNMCITAGLEGGHKSHGAGLAVDVVPKKGNSKGAWKDSTEAGARAIGWYGDSANDPKGSKKTCGERCMHEVEPDKFPKWARWIGYNGAACHGDPWHFVGCGAHLHIGWASPNGGDAVSSTAISKPIPAVYTFEAPIPSDLKGLVD